MTSFIMALELKAEKREILGRAVSTLRKAGFLPAELYGRGLQNQHLTLGAKDFKKVYKEAGEHTVVTVVVDGKKVPVIINDVSFDYLSGEPAHADLYQIRMDEKIQAKVPLEFIGEAPAVKNLGGVLVKTLQEILMEALPDKIPHSIIVKLDGLSEIGHTIHLSDLAIPADVKTLIDAQTVVVTIKAKMTEEQEAALSAAASLDTVKVETEEKKAERAAEKAEEAAPAAGAAPAPEAKK
mgnify:FL=1